MLENTKNRRGFTLIELMIVIAIIGIIVTMAIPAYDNYIRRSRRSDGHQALLDLASRLEQYYAERNTYATATVGSGNTSTDVLSTNQSPERYYTLAITAQTASSYTITATPQGSQAADAECTSYTYDNLGTKGFTGTGTSRQCWGN